MLVGGIQCRFAWLVIAHPPHEAPVEVDLLQCGLHVERYGRVGVGQRDLDPWEALAQLPRIERESIPPGPLADACEVVVWFDFLGTPFRNTEDVPASTQQVDLDQMAVSRENFLLLVPVRVS